MKKIIAFALIVTTSCFAVICEMNPELEDAFKPTSYIGTGIYRQELCIAPDPNTKKPGKVLLQTFVITTDGKKSFTTHFDSQLTDINCYCLVKKEKPIVEPKEKEKAKPKRGVSDEPNYRLQCVKC